MVFSDEKSKNFSLFVIYSRVSSVHVSRADPKLVKSASFLRKALRFVILREKQICSVSTRVSGACLCLVFDVLYLTSLASILFGFDQLAPSLAHVVAGLIHAVLNAVHHLTLPYHTWDSRTGFEGRNE